MEKYARQFNDRFNLDEANGVAYTIMGGELLGLTALGFIYTNLDTVSIGLGITLSDLEKTNKTPYDYLEDLKNHPSIYPLIKDAEVKEYSAHLIPEGGYKKIPKLTSNGVIVVGDAAGFVNGVHFEGTNFALISGKLAGESAINALNNNDFSERSLSVYRKKLEKSFILKDLYSYRNVIEKLYSRSDSLSIYWS